MKAMDFQTKTAERILEIFADQSRQGQKRVLLSDEVGLGKTIMAREVINRVGELRRDLNDDDYRIVYVCSNQNIIRQNIFKLVETTDVLKISDSRLSMQHLVLEERMARLRSEEDYCNGCMKTLLIPITPATSFSIQGGRGSKNERALMYAHIRRMEALAPYQSQLSKIFQLDVTDNSWKNDINNYEERINKVGIDYINRIQKKLSNEVLPETINDLVNMAQTNSWTYSTVIKIVNQLRKVFAKLSLDELQPDLVVMDEFQRFSHLLNTEYQSEETTIAQRFFEDEKISYMLLLSATPYKPYTTLEELNETNCDEQYEDFLNLMKFLNHGDNRFNIVWEDYSNALAHIQSEQLDILVAKKNLAQNQMYQVMCRTERLNEGLIQARPDMDNIPISEGDILSFCQMQHLMDKSSEFIAISHKSKLPMEYVKSSPYLLSFMKHYKEKKLIEAAYGPKQGRRTRILPSYVSQRLLLKQSKIETYKPIAPNNARLAYLQQMLFEQQQSHCLLWLPASKPYYQIPTDHVYAKNKNFSKLLVFSAWEMVPRMLAIMLSYESERRTIGSNQMGGYKSKKGAARLTDVEEKRNKHQKDQSLLTYTSRYLCELYDAETHYGRALKDVEAELIQRISADIKKLPIDESLPMGSAGVLQILQVLSHEQSSPIPIATPRTLLVIARLAIASPAVCFMRILQNEEIAKSLAKEFIGIFNQRESASVVDICSKQDNVNYYERVLEYCVMGNLQAVLEEFAHTIEEDKAHPEYAKRVAEVMIESFIDISTLDIDTDCTFCQSTQEEFRMRRNFAYDYANGKVVTDESVKHNVSLQHAFNSPFRPFVLATTSVGQEGLDFHRYCRKIVHWNLPSNPVDLEQREGRINRYKCLAIRRNIAHLFPKDFSWNQMFETAREKWITDYPERNYSQMVPYWCLPQEVITDDNNKGKLEMIERIFPMYPMSQDQQRYQHLIEVLSMYRLTMGQPRQEELLELLKDKIKPEDISKLLIDLSPYNKSKK